MVILIQTYLATSDESVIQRLVLNNWITMKQIAMSVLKNDADAEDAVQQSFLKLLENFDRFRRLEDQDIESLLYIMVRNSAIDIYRKNKVRCHDSFDENRDSITFSMPGEPFDNEIALAISMLGERERDVLLLKYSIGLNNREIATCLGITTISAQKIVSRARMHLKEILIREKIR